MAISSTYYLNGPSLSSSTTIYSDSSLTTIAPDGFYSDGIISREQVSGILLPAIPCGSCATPCGGTINGSGAQGIYLLNLDAGSTASDVGAVVVRFNPQSVPDGIRVVYNGNTYNKLSSPVDGLHQSTDPNGFTVIGTLGADCGLTGNTTNFPAITEYLYVGSSFVATGNTQNITISPGDVSLGSTPGVCVMVIPKVNASPSIFNFEIIGPCGGTAWNIAIDCPVLLPSFLGSLEYGSVNIPCTEAIDQTYYFAKVHTAVDTFVGLYDYVFVDEYGATPLANGFYLISNVAAPNKVIEVSSGIVVAITDCSTPEIIYNSVVAVDNCADTEGVASTIVDIAESSIIIGAQLYLTGGVTTLPLGVYRMAIDLVNGNTYNIGTIPVSSYIIEVDSSGFIINITNC